jgi:FtsZ-binding cell division protein ZapB
MTATEMDQLTTSEPPSTEVEPYSPPPRSRAPRSISIWTPIYAVPQRRWWTIALAAAVLIAVGGIGLLYMDDTNNQSQVRSLTLQTESLNGRNQILQDQLKTTQDNLTATLGQLAQTRADLEHPNLVLWTLPEQIKGANYWLEGGIPDTFTYHLHVTSTGPMSVSILTFSDYAKASACVNSGGGTAYYCMNYSGAVIGWMNKTKIDYDFHLAEGCAGYLAVFTSTTNVTVKPNISVTYNPSSKLTGVCAG